MKDSRRRCDALLFLSNISLDGSVKDNNIYNRGGNEVTKSSAQLSGVPTDERINSGSLENEKEVEVRVQEKAPLRRTQSATSQTSTEKIDNVSPRKNR